MRCYTISLWKTHFRKPCSTPKNLGHVKSSTERREDLHFDPSSCWNGGINKIEATTHRFVENDPWGNHALLHQLHHHYFWIEFGSNIQWRKSLLFNIYSKLIAWSVWDTRWILLILSSLAIVDILHFPANMYCYCNLQIDKLIRTFVIGDLSVHLNLVS